MFKSIRSIAAASMVLAGAALLQSNPAAAQMRYANQGEDASVSYDAGYAGNILGGGAVRVSGKGEGVVIRHEDARFTRAAAGTPVFQGGSEGDIAYLPVDNTVLMAGQ